MVILQRIPTRRSRKLKWHARIFKWRKENYQFSARAVIDRYKKNDMPLGWFLPNDGYGAGYGQTDSLDGDVQNLKEFTEYAQANGVEVGLWTQSNLHPADPKILKKENGYCERS